MGARAKKNRKKTLKTKKTERANLTRELNKMRLPVPKRVGETYVRCA